MPRTMPRRAGSIPYFDATHVRQIAPGNFNACAIVGDGALK